MDGVIRGFIRSRELNWLFLLASTYSRFFDVDLGTRMRQGLKEWSVTSSSMTRMNRYRGSSPVLASRSKCTYSCASSRTLAGVPDAPSRGPWSSTLSFLRPCHDCSFALPSAGRSVSVLPSSSSSSHEKHLTGMYSLEDFNHFWQI